MLEAVSAGALACAAGFLLWAALHDVATRTIPDTVSVVLAGIGLGLRLADGDLQWALLAAGLVFGIAFLGWRFGLLGGGDVKLLGTVALLVPPAFVASQLLAIALAGGVVALAYLLLGPLLRARPAGPRPASLPARALRAEAWRIRRRGPLPYAVAIAAGTFVTLFPMLVPSGA